MNNDERKGLILLIIIIAVCVVGLMVIGAAR